MGRRSPPKLEMDLDGQLEEQRARFESLPAVADALVCDPGGGGEVGRKQRGLSMSLHKRTCLAVMRITA